MAFVPMMPIPVSMFTSSTTFNSGGKLKFFEAGTTTPTNVYSDKSGTIIGTEITLDARGEATTVKSIFLDTDKSYKIEMVDSSDVTIWGPLDNIDPYRTIPLGNVFGNTILTKSADYTVAATDEGKIIECSGTFTVTLLAAATAGNGFTIVVSNVGTGGVTVDGSGSETINGKTLIGLAPGESLLIGTNGTTWVGIIQRSPVTAYESVSTTTNPSNDDRGKVYECTAALTMNLPTITSAAQNPLPFHIFVYNSSAGNLTLDPSGAETINGSATLVLPPGGAGMVASDGTSAWVFIGNVASSTAISGIVELATGPETRAGTDTARAISPSGLASRFFSGYCDAGASAEEVPTGWSITNPSTGVYTVTHNLALSDVNNLRLIPVTEGVGHATLNNAGANSIDVQTRDMSNPPALVSTLAWYFIAESVD